MKFLLIICHDDSFAPTERLITDIEDWEKRMTPVGIRVSGNPLRPPGDAATVRVREGRTLRIDGPFSDAREQMAAYELVECPGLDEAVDVAASHPMAEAGTIEVRPVWAELVRTT